MNITFITTNLYFNTKPYDYKLYLQKNVRFNGHGMGEEAYCANGIIYRLFYGFSSGNGTSRYCSPEELKCQLIQI